MSIKSICRGCGAGIMWIRVGEKMHPVNPKSFKVFVLDEAIKRESGTENYKLMTGYESHFSTCPNAIQFRKPKGELA